MLKFKFYKGEVLYNNVFHELLPIHYSFLNLRFYYPLGQ